MVRGLVQKGELKRMRIDNIEIYSDATNAAVMRHPGRAFPGVLIQGDTLHSLAKQADLICAGIGIGSDAFEEADDLRGTLWALVNHYKATLVAHSMDLPFSSISN
ncbi:hypothetical protein NKJ90_10270 [Mesorhizobium sp. M0051]|uniref:DUF6959 family protein n=1 Tax=unclassified Mesorhizobium TaxID=325217 RepID=UPI0003CE78E4|nr:hypothetical protein [Mesorhizobium sp. LNHC252B00]ESY71999.1 hypothetical protein X743_18350 [Mesorhizobium sp. LNHC252B00]